MVWRIKMRAGYCYLVLVLEFQSVLDWWMAVRIAAYTALLYQDIIKAEKLKRENNLPPILPIVLYNGKKPWDAPLAMRALLPAVPEELAQFQPDMRYYLIDIGRLEENALGDPHNIASLIFRFERSTNIGDLLPVLYDLVKALQGDDGQHLHKLFINWLGNSIFRNTAISRDITSCSTIEEAYDMLADIAPEWEEYFIAKGIEKGIEKGRMEGREKGRMETMKQAIKDIVKLRFGNGAELDCLVDGIWDPVKLQSLYDYALTCSSRANFEKTLGKK